MKQALQILKKEPIFTILGLCAVIGALWFWLAPGPFKVFWGKNPVVVEMIKQHNLVEQNAKIDSIMVYYPTLAYFAEIFIGMEKPKLEKMDSYYLGQPYIFRTYYRKAVDLLPDNDAAHYLLGYSCYYLQEVDLARVEFEKSLALNPNFFWTYYNLGVIYFQQGDFSKSAGILTKAFSFNINFTIEILRQNLFYGQIWAYVTNPGGKVQSNLNEGQEAAVLIMTDCFVKAKEFGRAAQLIQDLGQRSPWHHDLWKALYQKVLRRSSSTEDIDRLIREQIPVRIF